MKKIICLFFFFIFFINVLAKEVIEAKYIKILELKTYVENNNVNLFVPVSYKNIKIYSYTYYLSGKKVAKTKENNYLYKNLKKGRRYLLKVEVNTSEGIKQKDTTVTINNLEPTIKIENPDKWTVSKKITINLVKNSINFIKINKGDVLLKQGIIETKTTGNVLEENNTYPIITKKIVLEVLNKTSIQITTKIKEETKNYHIQIEKIDTLAPIIKAKYGNYQIPYGTNTNPINYFTVKWGKSGPGKISCNPSNTNILDYGNQEISCKITSLNGKSSQASKEITIVT